METVLYEYHLNFADYLGNLIPLVCGIAFLYVFIRIIKDKNNTTSRFVKIASGSICLIVSILSIAIFLLVTISMSIEHTNYKEQIANDNVCVVEGYIENFHPMPYEGHDTEHFEINGIYFEYSDFSIINGYHKSSSHGGVVTHNGQYLKIKYIVNEYNGIKENIILYIAEIDVSK